jgi:hypothetical protein
VRVEAAVWGLLALASGVAVPVAQADTMDLALSRLRIVGGRPGCLDPSTASQFCPNQELFERIVSELAVSMAPSVAPARTIGPRAFQLAFESTMTTIDAEESHWILGTEGSGGLEPGADIARNEAPQSVMLWNRLQLRKGLPFGFEVGAALGHGLNTSLYTLGLALKWSIVEGFRTGLGRLPDVAVQGQFQRNVGASQVTVQLFAVDLTLSKPFVIEHAWTLSPLLGVQTLFVTGESGVVDLTPGGPSSTSGTNPATDATRACVPEPGQPAATLQCTGDAADVVNDVKFEDITQTRVRAFAGAQARYEFLVTSLTLLFDLAPPDLDAEPLQLASSEVARQLAFHASVGAVF